MNAGRTPRWPIHLGMTATLILLVCPPAEGAGTEVPLRSPVAQQKKLTAADAGGGDHFGSSTAIDGARMVVSANHDGGGDSGSAYIFERDSGGAENWGQVKKLTAADAEAWAVFGVSVAIEGSTVVIGSPWKNATAADSGAAYVFERDFGGPGNWGQVKRLTAADAAAWDLFGMSVAISGSTVVVGCRFDDDAGSESGSAYIFERDFGGPGNWGQVKKLTAADAAAADEFGTWLAIDGSTVVVGSFHDDDAGTDSGSAYVFERDFGGPDNWGQVKKLVAADAAAGDRFGNSVAIAGSTVLIGASANDAAGTDSGSVYVFERDFGGPGNWGQVKKLTAADAGASDFFGSRVACTDSMVVTAAQLDDDGGADSGAAYVFARNVGGADNWGQVQKLTAADAGAGDQFGYAVTISG
ncbi:MAG: hypothetical protein GY856_22670, partial [bacterium]|nr:hypothetical protein [bacterium]